MKNILKKIYILIIKQVKFLNLKLMIWLEFLKKEEIFLINRLVILNGVKNYSKYIQLIDQT